MIEKIIDEIHRLKNDLDGYSALEGLDYIESYINALSGTSLPSNLDEAAFIYENDLWESGFKDSGYTPQEVSDAFKAGAEYDRSTVKAELLEWAKTMINICQGAEPIEKTFRIVIDKIKSL